jgi:hypothetical protein
VKLTLKLAVLAVIGLLLCSVPAASTQTGQPAPPCTGGASSISLGEPPVTTWYPAGCAHP